jgi:hypothetical protein
MGLRIHSIIHGFGIDILDIPISSTIRTRLSDFSVCGRLVFDDSLVGVLRFFLEF